MSQPQPLLRSSTKGSSVLKREDSKGADGKRDGSKPGEGKGPKLQLSASWDDSDDPDEHEMHAINFPSLKMSEANATTPSPEGRALGMGGEKFDTIGILRRTDLEGAREALLMARQGSSRPESLQKIDVAKSLGGKSGGRKDDAGNQRSSLEVRGP